MDSSGAALILAIMELKWLEDFISLAQTSNFSRSAELRHVTQPALSKRIRSLEQWLGIDLIDRSTYPIQLSKAGIVFLDHAQNIVREAKNARTKLHTLNTLPKNRVRIAMPHTLAFSFFPDWLSLIQAKTSQISTQVLTQNVLDAVLSLTEGLCDLVILYQHPRFPIDLDPLLYRHCNIGKEQFLPYAKTNGQRQALWTLPGNSDAPIPFLNYTENAYLYRMVNLILEQAPYTYYLEQTGSTDMSEVLKMMVLAGHGLAFLPKTAVKKELRQGKLAQAGSDDWCLEMEIKLYSKVDSKHPWIETLWQTLNPA